MNYWKKYVAIHEYSHHVGTNLNTAYLQYITEIQNCKTEINFYFKVKVIQLYIEAYLYANTDEYRDDYVGFANNGMIYSFDQI